MNKMSRQQLIVMKYPSKIKDKTAKRKKNCSENI